MSLKKLYEDPRGEAYRLGDSFLRGDISRRSFLTRAVALSLSTPAVSAILDGVRPAVALAQGNVNTDVSGGIRVISNTGAGAESVAWNERIDAFQALYPKVKVARDEKVGETFYKTADTVLLQIAGGNAPDTMRVGNFSAAQLGARGALMPLDELIAGDPEVDWDDFYSGAQNAFKVDGKIFALPENGESYGLNYNRTAFKNAGLPDPREQWDSGEWTHEAFLEAAKTLTVGKGINKKFGFLHEVWNSENWIFFNGGKVLDEDLKTVLIDQPAAYEGLQFAADLTNIHSVAPNPLQYTAERGPIAQFQNGTGSMYMLGGWYIANFRNDITNFEYMTAGAPIGPGGKTSKLEISGYAISSDTPNPEASWEFIKFIASPVGQKIWSVVGTPTRRSSLDQFLATSAHALWFEPFVEVLENVQHTPFFKNSAEINQILSDGQAPIFLGQQSAKKATAAMADDMRAVLRS